MLSDVFWVVTATHFRNYYYFLVYFIRILFYTGERKYFGGINMDYNIQGTPLPVLVFNLAPGETVITERGSMAWRTPNVEMSTDGGGIGKMFNRFVSQEGLMQTSFTAQGSPGMIAFASSFPGSIRGFEIKPGMSIIAQKSAFLAATSGVEVGIHFNKKLGAGFFGGEGFIMQKFSGQGMVFVELDGFAVDYTLNAGQQLVLDTGHLVAMSDTCSIDIERNKGVKNVLFGGAGLFNTVITGPGTVVLQTMPSISVANSLAPYFSNNSSGGNSGLAGAVVDGLFQ